MVLLKPLWGMSLVMNWHHTFWKCLCVSGGIGELTFHVCRNQLRGNGETSLEGRLGRKNWACFIAGGQNVAMNSCNMLSNAFSKCFLSPLQGALLHGERGWESWALKSTSQKCSRWRATQAESLTYSSHSGYAMEIEQKSCLSRKYQAG